MVAQNPGLANPEISKIIGEQWRGLPQETKDEWKALAEVSTLYAMRLSSHLTLDRRRKLGINNNTQSIAINLVATVGMGISGVEHLASAITLLALQSAADVEAV